MAERRRAWGLVERDLDLARLGGGLEAARSGRGGVVVIEGAAGHGKSSLLHATVEMAANAHMRVLSARGSALESEFPFGIVLQLFETEVHRAPAAQRRRWLSGGAAPASSLLEVEPPDPTRDAEPASGALSFPLLRGLTRLTSNMAEKGLVLAIDDAQSADRRSLEFVHYLGGRSAELGILVVLTVRTGERPAAGDLVDEIQLLPQTRTLKVRALSPLAVAELTTQSIAGADYALGQACWQATAGNPFLLKELLLTIAATPGTPPSALDVSLLRPDAVTRAVLVRLARMPEGSLELCRAVAVLGDACSLSVACELASISAAQGATLLDQLVVGEILRLDDGLIGFVHPIIENIVGSGIPAGRLGVAHLRAAELLQSTAASPEVVASHLLRTAPQSQPWVVDVLKTAAARAELSGTPASAVRLLERAVAEPPPAGDAPAVWAALGRASLRLGDRRCGDQLAHAATMAPEGAGQSRLRLEAARAFMAFGRLDEAGAALRVARAGADADAHRLLRALDFELCPTSLIGPGDDVEAADGSHLPLDVDSIAQSAMSATFKGDHRDRVLPLARRALVGARGLYGQSPTLHFVTRALTWNDDLDTALDVLATAIEQACSDGSVPDQIAARAGRAMALRLSGDLRGAVADAELAAAGAAQGLQAFLPAARATLALAYLELGQLDMAAAAVDRSVADHGHYSYAAVHYARGALAAVGGQHHEAISNFRAAGACLTDVGFVSPAWLPWRSAAGVSIFRTGGDGRDLIEEELDLARSTGNPRIIGSALSGLAAVHDGPAAAELQREAIEVLASSPARLLYARSRLELGCTLRRQGRRNDARTELTAALETADRAHAAPMIERARQELALLGCRPRRSALSGPESLTAAERRVAELAAAGHTNREIADTLFITTKTVEFHLRQVFMKLGVSSRKELGRFPVPSAARL